MRISVAIVTVLVGLAMAGCSWENQTAPTATNGSSSSPVTSTAPSVGPDGSPPEVMRSLDAKAGIPPEPDAAAADAYIAALVAIDPDIVHGKPDKAISRGRNQCSSVKQQSNDQAKLVQLTNLRFTSPDHPNGFGLDKSARILDAVRTYLCP